MATSAVSGGMVPRVNAAMMASPPLFKRAGCAQAQVRAGGFEGGSVPVNQNFGRLRIACLGVCNKRCDDVRHVGFNQFSEFGSGRSAGWPSGGVGAFTGFE